MAGERANPAENESADSGERARIATAMIELVGARGFRQTSLEMVLDAASVGEETFRNHFADMEDCFVSVWDELNLEHARLATAAYEGNPGWRDRIRAMAELTLGFLQADANRTRFLVVEVLNAGEIAQAHRDLVIAGQAALLDEGRQELDDPEAVPRSVAEHLAGAINEMLVRKTVNGEIFNGGRVLRELMYMAVRPYLGHEAALEELRIPQPERGEEHG